MSGDGSHFGMLHRRELMTWGIWVLLSPAIIIASRRNQFGQYSVWNWFGRQLLLAFGFALVSALLVATLRVVLASWLHDAAPRTPMDMIANFAGDILRYTLISVAYQTFAYHRAVREREALETTLRAELAEAKLANMESSLHPHFLFNTLNSIAVLVRRDPRAAETMVEQLSDLLRASLRAHPMREVSLDEELKLLEQYLAIQAVRYQERLRTSISASANVRRARVPQLILQPLVENAIRHGIGPLERRGLVSVTASVNESVITLIVEDDGIGLGNSPSSLAGTGLGVKSAQSRLQHLYGVDQSFDIRAVMPSGTRVVITLPFRPVGA